MERNLDKSMTCLLINEGNNCANRSLEDLWEKKKERINN